MDIVSRLKLFLQQNGIANSQFADTCDIPRPTLSQLLNGRNKKVSDELISKIHRAYPSLNIMWLMFGDGEMFVTGMAPAVSPEMPQGDAASFQPTAAVREPAHASQGMIDFGATDSDFSAPQRRQPKPVSISDAMQHMAAAAAMKPVGKKSTTSGERHVTHMMVFYSDGRFETFVPGN